MTGIGQMLHHWSVRKLSDLRDSHGSPRFFFVQCWVNAESLWKYNVRRLWMVVKFWKEGTFSHVCWCRLSYFLRKVNRTLQKNPGFTDTARPYVRKLPVVTEATQCQFADIASHAELMSLCQGKCWHIVQIFIIIISMMSAFAHQKKIENERW